MKYRNLGRTGLKVSQLCLGTMQFGWTADETLSHEILNYAFGEGVNFIDTANVYSRWVEGNEGGVAEELIGKWLKKYNIPRDQVILATKVRGKMGEGPNDQGLSRAHIFNEIEASIKRLQTDYIDLYQVHWYDEETPIDETLSAFNDLIRQGKVRYIGASNFPAWRLMRSLWTADKYGFSRFDSLQPNYSLVHRKEFESELKEVCLEYGIAVIPYSPLAGGFLSGKYQKGKSEPKSERAKGVIRRYVNEKSWEVLEKVEEIAKVQGKSVSQIALGWQLTNPAITSPIVGPRTMDQLKDNLGAAELRLSFSEMEELDSISNWK